MVELSRLFGKPARVVFYELAVVNFVRVGMWRGIGYDPLARILNALDRAFASSPILSATNFGGFYSAISLLSILLSIAIVLILGRKWGAVTIVISLLAGIAIGAGSVLGTLLVLPSMLLGVYAPLVKNQGNSSRHASYVR